MTIPAKPGTLTLYYPKWIPGEHGPTGPIQDLAGLKFTAEGKLWPGGGICWMAGRSTSRCRRACPASKPRWTSSRPPGQEGIYTGGATATDQMAVVNWNAMVLYPQGWTSDELTYTASLRLPARLEIRHLAGRGLAVGRRNQVRSGFAHHAGRWPGHHRTNI